MGIPASKLQGDCGVGPRIAAGRQFEYSAIRNHRCAEGVAVGGARHLSERNSSPYRPCYGHSGNIRREIEERGRLRMSDAFSI